MNLQDKAREILRLLGDINEMEKTVSRLKNELMEEWHRVDDSLDLDLQTFDKNPVVQKMSKNSLDSDAEGG